MRTLFKSLPLTIMVLFFGVSTGFLFGDSEQPSAPLQNLSSSGMVKPPSEKAAPEWLYQETVQLKRIYDPNSVLLNDGRELSLDSVYYTDGAFEDETARETEGVLNYVLLSEFEVGHTLQIAYAKSCGAVLRDPQSGAFLEITAGLEAHPIDQIQQQKEREGSTADLILAAHTALELWELEIDRLLRKLKTEHPDQAEAIEQAHATWKAFQEAQFNLNRVANDKNGTLYPLNAARQRVDLTRNYALNLATWGRY